MKAAEEQTTPPAATEWAYRSDADGRRAVDALLRDPLWSLLSDEAIASITEASSDMVRERRRAIGSVAPPSSYGERGQP
jgi:hypothetical protein